MTSLSVIGTAGRKPVGDRINLELYNKAYNALVEYVESLNILAKDLLLISGGAAFADHLAVRFYNEYYKSGIKLLLHMPAQFDKGNSEFYGNKDANIANNYHQLFSQKCKINSLNEISQAYKNGMLDRIHDGFFARNRLVALGQNMIAFTFSSTGEPADGGTSNTWKQCKGNKLHIDLGSL